MDHSEPEGIVLINLLLHPNTLNLLLHPTNFRILRFPHTLPCDLVDYVGPAIRRLQLLPDCRDGKGGVGRGQTLAGRLMVGY